METGLPNNLLNPDYRFYYSCIGSSPLTHLELKIRGPKGIDQIVSTMFYCHYLKYRKQLQSPGHDASLLRRMVHIRMSLFTEAVIELDDTSVVPQPCIVHQSLLLKKLQPFSCLNQRKAWYFFPGGRGAIDLEGPLQIIIAASTHKSRKKSKSWMDIHRILPNAMLWLIEQILKEQLEEGARGSLLSAKSIRWIFNRAWQLQLLQFNLKDISACNVMLVTDYTVYSLYSAEAELQIYDCRCRKTNLHLMWKLVATFTCFWMIACQFTHSLLRFLLVGCIVMYFITSKANIWANMKILPVRPTQWGLYQPYTGCFGSVL